MTKKKVWAIVLVSLAALLAAGIVVYIIFFMPRKSPVYESVRVEVGSQSVSVDQFKIEAEKSVELLTDIKKIDLTKVADHKIGFKYHRQIFYSVLSVVDTTPPTATAVSKEIYNDETLTPSDFVTEIKDYSEVKTEFATSPDFTKVGEHTVEIKLTDKYGNKAVIPAKLVVKKDVTPPEIKGMSNITIRVGQTASYKKGVTATDDRDGELEYTVDSSKVDLQKEGEYTVTYTATDKSGNVTTAQRKLTVLPKLVINRALVDSMAKDVLKKIITPNMNSHQKVKAVFNWVRSNMVYTSSKENDIPNAAYVAFEKKRGDCFNYYAVTTVLLDNCGIENMKVERYGGKTSHYWLLVNAGTGWYHYDTTPQNNSGSFRCFMKTDQEVWDYAKSRSDKRTDYYNFDTSKYPARATEKYPY